MRRILIIITAFVLAVGVFGPAMGFTISTGAKTNYSINSEKANYTISSGTPAQETSYSEEMAEHHTTYSIGSKAKPYSIKLGSTGKYSAKAVIDATKIDVLGGQKASVLGTSENIGEVLVVSKENATKNATEQAVGHAAPKVQGQSLVATTPALPVTQRTNVTSTAVSKNISAPIVLTNETIPKPVNLTIPTNVATSALPSVNQKLKVEGKVYEDKNKNAILDINDTGLANWIVSIELPSGRVTEKAATNQTGGYGFYDIMPGEYVVTEALQSGWFITAPTNDRLPINLTKNVSGLDFGNERITTSNETHPANNTTLNTTVKN